MAQRLCIIDRKNLGCPIRHGVVRVDGKVQDKQGVIDTHPLRDVLRCRISSSERAYHGTVTSPGVRFRHRCGPLCDAEYQHTRRGAGYSVEHSGHDDGQSDHRGGTAEPGSGRDPELGSVAGGPQVGHHGRHRRRSHRRQHLGLRALRRGNCRRWSCRLRQHARSIPSSSSIGRPARCSRTSARASW